MHVCEKERNREIESERSGVECGKREGTVYLVMEKAVAGEEATWKGRC